MVKPVACVIKKYAGVITSSYRAIEKSVAWHHRIYDIDIYLALDDVVIMLS